MKDFNKLKKIRHLRVLRRTIYFLIIPNSIYTLTQITDNNFQSIILFSHMLVWIIVFAISIKFKCPNCEKSFSSKENSSFRNPWTKKCLNCGISINEDKKQKVPNF